MKPEIDEKAKQTVANHCSEEVGFFLTTIAKKKKAIVIPLLINLPKLPSFLHVRNYQLKLSNY